MKPMTAAELLSKYVTTQAVRYEAVHDDAMVVEDDGEWVRHADYARLAAENRSLAARVAELEAELAEARRDATLAAGELMVSLDDAPIGSLAARLLAANGIMRGQRDQAREERDRAERLAAWYAATLTKFGEPKRGVIRASRALLEADLRFTPNGLAHLAAVRAVTRAATTDDAPPHEGAPPGSET